jgi:hypothetical protein
MTLYQVMSESPYLTALVCIVLLQACTNVAQYFFDYLAIRKHGHKPVAPKPVVETEDE